MSCDFADDASLDGFIASLLEADGLPRLGDEDLKRLRAYLKADPSENDQRNKLETILSFNDRLRQSVSAQPSADQSNTPACPDADALRERVESLQVLTAAIDTLHGSGDGPEDRTLSPIREQVIRLAAKIGPQARTVRDALSRQGMLTGDRKDNLANLISSLDFIARTLRASTANSFGYRVTNELAPTGVVEQWDRHWHTVRHSAIKMCHWADAMADSPQANGSGSQGGAAADQCTEGARMSHSSPINADDERFLINLAQHVRANWAKYVAAGQWLDREYSAESMRQKAEGIGHAVSSQSTAFPGGTPDCFIYEYPEHMLVSPSCRVERACLHLLGLGASLRFSGAHYETARRVVLLTYLLTPDAENDQLGLTELERYGWGENHEPTADDSGQHFEIVFDRKDSEKGLLSGGDHQTEWLKLARRAWGLLTAGRMDDLVNQDQAAAEQYITLDQAAAIVSRHKSTLRRVYDNGDLPEPDVRGTGGAPHEWKWATLRPELQRIYNRELPERYPDRR